MRNCSCILKRAKQKTATTRPAKIRAGVTDAADPTRMPPSTLPPKAKTPLFPIFRRRHKSLPTVLVKGQYHAPIWARMEKRMPKFRASSWPLFTLGLSSLEARSTKLYEARLSTFFFYRITSFYGLRPFLRTPFTQAIYVLFYHLAHSYRLAWSSVYPINI